MKVFLVRVCLLALPVTLHANSIPALSFTGGTSHSASGDVTAGWAFSLSSTFTVSALGIWDSSNGGGVGDGLTESHLVTIWTSTGVQVAQATVPSGTTGSLVDGFRYVSLLSSVVLPAGDYTIGGYYNPADPDQIAFSPSTVTTAADVTIVGSRLGGGNGFPSGDSGGNGGQPNAYFGPNFEFVGPMNGTSVPDDGSTWLLMLLGLAIVSGLDLAGVKAVK